MVKNGNKFNDGQASDEFVFLFNKCQFYVSKGLCHGEKRENIKMNNRIELFDAANYFADLFLNYKDKINCTSVKIQKLILILQLLVVEQTNGNENFTNIKKVLIAPCGCKIPEVESYISSFFIEGKSEDQPLNLTDKERIELLYPKLHNNPLFNDNCIDDKTKIMMIDVFDNFGLYSAKTIGEFFDPLRPEKIKNIIPYTADITEFNSWILESFESMNNHLEEYIKDRI